MEIKEIGGHCSLNWNGTRTKLDIVSVDGRLVFRGDSTMIDGEFDYFVKVSDPETLEQMINILNMMEP